jgi:hypothetical protein
VRAKSIMAALAAAAAATALACGFCVEDRVAAVYDSTSIEAAMAGHRHVAFLGVDGETALDAQTQRALVKALESAGAVRGATRVAGENAACAVFYDPKKTTLERLLAAAGRALAPQHRSVKALRIIDGGGKLREP